MTNSVLRTNINVAILLRRAIHCPPFRNPLDSFDSSQGLTDSMVPLRLGRLVWYYLFVCPVLGIPQVILTTLVLVLHSLGAGEISDEIANLIIRQCLN